MYLPDAVNISTRVIRVLTSRVRFPAQPERATSGLDGAQVPGRSQARRRASRAGRPPTSSTARLGSGRPVSLKAAAVQARQRADGGPSSQQGSRHDDSRRRAPRARPYHKPEVQERPAHEGVRAADQLGDLDLDAAVVDIEPDRVADDDRRRRARAARSRDRRSGGASASMACKPLDPCRVELDEVGLGQRARIVGRERLDVAGDAARRAARPACAAADCLRARRAPRRSPSRARNSSSASSRSISCTLATSARASIVRASACARRRSTSRASGTRRSPPRPASDSLSAPGVADQHAQAGRQRERDADHEHREQRRERLPREPAAARRAGSAGAASDSRRSARHQLGAPRAAVAARAGRRRARGAGAACARSARGRGSRSARVTPTSLKRVNSCMISSDRSGSRLPVGSSAISTSGRAATARAMPTRCCSPADSVIGACVSRPSKPDLVERGAHAPVDLAAARAGDDQRQRHVVEDACGRPAACGPGTRRRAAAGTPESAGARSAQVFWPLTSTVPRVGRSISAISLARALAGAGTAGEERQLAALETERDAVERLAAARVALGDVLEADHRRRVSEQRARRIRRHRNRRNRRALADADEAESARRAVARSRARCRPWRCRRAW